MAKLTKPYNVNIIWSSNGVNSDPNTTPGFTPATIQTGWTTDLPPPLEDFNFIDNRQDRFAAYVNQLGIVEWDKDTPYEAPVSFVQVNGKVYQARKSSTNVNPVGDTTSTWSQAFATPEDLAAAIEALRSSLQSQIDQIKAQTASDLRFRGKGFFTGQF